MERLLTIDEVAEVLRLEPGDVDGLVDADELDAVEISPGVRRISRPALRRFIQTRRRQFRPFAIEPAT